MRKQASIEEAASYGNSNMILKYSHVVPAIRTFGLSKFPSETDADGNIMRVANAKAFDLPTGKPLDVSWLKAASETYKISPDYRDYVICEVPIVTADVPNRNMDCLAKGTLVQTDVGLVPIQDIRKSGAKNVLTPKGPRKIHNWRKVGYLDTVGIKLADGRVLRGTPDHEILVLNPKTMGTEWKPLGELSTSDYVICQTGEIVERPTKLPEAVSPTEFLELSVGGRDDKRYSRSINEITVPNTMTPELARLLGYLISEGTVTHPNTVSFTNSDRDLLDDFCHCWESVFGLKVEPHFRSPRESSAESGYVYGSSVLARQWLAELGMGYVKANKKRVPWTILRSGKKLSGEFLRSYIAGDGCVSGGRIQMFSSSKNLLKEIQVLLFSFGVKGKLGLEAKEGRYLIRGKEYECNSRWSLELPLKDSKSLIDQIGEIPGDKGKQEYGYEEVRGEVIPFAKETLQKLADDRREGRDGVGGPYQYKSDDDKLVTGLFSPGKQAYVDKKAAREMLGMAKKISSELGANLEYLCREDILTVAVSKAYESKKEWVYDIGVEDAHCFIANGVVAHNCFTYKELTYYSPLYGCMTWQTFRGKPTHVDHDNRDPTKAKGAIFDVAFRKEGKVYHVSVALGFDRTKDPELVKEIIDSKVNGFSMGALVSYTTCSICGFKSNGRVYCDEHIGFKGAKKGQIFDGRVAYECCWLSNYIETSRVRSPADINAYTEKKDLLF